MSKRTISTPSRYRDWNTSSSSDASDNEISNDERRKIRKVYNRIKTNKVSLQMCPRHPGLTKQHFQLFLKSGTTYSKLIKFIYSKGLYSWISNEIRCLTSQNIEEAIKYIFVCPDQRTKNTFTNNISIFLKKYNKELLDDLKNWHQHRELPMFDPERKLLRAYIYDIVDVLLKRQELSNAIIDIISDKYINDNDMNIILNDIHKDEDLDYYKNYLKFMLAYHYKPMVEILSKKLVLKIRENTTSHLNKQDGFTQSSNQSISNKNDNTSSIKKNDILLKNSNESQLNQQRSIANTAPIEFMIKVLSKKLIFKIHENATNHFNKQNSFTQPSNQSILNKNNDTSNIKENNTVVKIENESQWNQQKSRENTVDLKSQDKMIDNYSKKSTVNKFLPQNPGLISSTSLIEADKSFQITSSQIIKTENFENQELNSDIITIDDSDNELKTNVKLEKNNAVDVGSNIFDKLRNNEILPQWDEKKDKSLIRFILNNPDYLQKERTYKKLLTLEPQMFKGFKPEHLKQRKDYLAYNNNYLYLIKLCGYEKIKTEEDKVLFNKEIELLRRLMNFSVKMEVD